ncbi:hypothetical protein V1505DRAFT_395110 [Lipomyces doorenjongii]
MAEAEKAGGSATIYQIPEHCLTRFSRRCVQLPNRITRLRLPTLSSTMTPSCWCAYPVQQLPRPMESVLGDHWHHGMISSRPRGVPMTFAGGDGPRQPSALEEEVASIQGETFYKVIVKAFD